MVETLHLCAATLPKGPLLFHCLPPHSHPHLVKKRAANVYADQKPFVWFSFFFYSKSKAAKETGERRMYFFQRESESLVVGEQEAKGSYGGSGLR